MFVHPVPRDMRCMYRWCVSPLNGCGEQWECRPKRLSTTPPPASEGGTWRSVSCSCPGRTPTATSRIPRHVPLDCLVCCIFELEHGLTLVLPQFRPRPGSRGTSHTRDPPETFDYACLESLEKLWFQTDLKRGTGYGRCCAGWRGPAEALSSTQVFLSTDALSCQLSTQLTPYPANRRPILPTDTLSETHMEALMSWARRTSLKSAGAMSDPEEC